MKKVLVIAPHADDETLGMGASIAKFASEGESVSVAIMTGHGEIDHPIWPKENWEQVRDEARAAMDVLGVETLIFEELPAACLSEFPTHEINEKVNSIIQSISPEILFLPFYHDLHKDHELLCYAGLVASRPYLHNQIETVAMYETLTETHLMPPHIAPPFSPNLTIDVSDYFHLKLDAWACYESQQQSGYMPRTARSLEALASLRGAHIGKKFAESFVVVHSKL